MPTCSSMPSLLTRAPNRFRSRSSLTAVATAGVVAAPAIVQAQIVYSGVLDTVVDYQGNGEGWPLATLEFQGTPTDGSELVLSAKKGAYSPSGDLALAQPTVISYGDTAINFTSLSAGDTIDSSLTFATSGTFEHARATSYYYGFSYSPDSVDGTLYGWFQYTMNDTTNLADFTLNDWAYNSVVGESITVGQTSAVPEPAAFGGLLGLAVLGIVLFRRKRHLCSRPA